MIHILKCKFTSDTYLFHPTSGNTENMIAVAQTKRIMPFAWVKKRQYNFSSQHEIILFISSPRDFIWIYVKLTWFFENCFRLIKGYWITKNLSRLTVARDRISESAATLPIKPLIAHPKVNQVRNIGKWYLCILFYFFLWYHFCIWTDENLLPCGPNTGPPLKPWYALK